MTKPPLTILLGAGSTANLGLEGPPRGMPSTKEITGAVRGMRLPAAIKLGMPVRYWENQQPSVTSIAEIPIIGHIFSRLASHYRPDSINFELLLYALEELDPYVFAKTSRDIADEYRPVLHAFTRLKRRSEFLQEIGFLNQLRRQVIHKIVETFIQREAGLGADPARSMRALISKLEQRFTISVFTLNYDDIIDRARDVWFDGFDVPIGGTAEDGGQRAWAFNSARFAQRGNQDIPLLVHLHGSIRYGHLARTLFGMGHDPGEFVKYENAQTAYDSIIGMASGDDVSGGRIVSAATIISGLNKVEKVMSNPVPYGYYYLALIEALLKSTRLMMIGYGGRDAHMNTWLNEFTRAHGNRRKTVYVGKLPGDTAFAPSAERTLMSMFADRGDVQRIWDDPDGQKFQLCGSLGVIASGAPMDDPTIDQAVEFLE